MKQEKFRSHCPINFSLEALGDKWSLLIVRDLLFMGKQSYGDFLASEENIATNILADRLVRLEAAGVIEKKFAENSARAMYCLTERGLDLLPMLLEMILWGAKYDADTNMPAAFIKRIKNDMPALIAEILAQHHSK